MRIMISNAVGSAFSCLVAIAILALSESPSLAWRLSSGWVLVGTVGVSAANFFLIIRHLEAHAPRHAILWWFFAVASVAIHAANTIGLFGGPSFGLFFLGSVVLLSQAGSQFLFMVSTHLGRSAA
ncbi:MAG: hypothetical protein JRH10_02080 [Deltaproteobacteria bacterium]|nr:hypothetical protein [Deltaproteobacteria bacterium]MBW2445450.1 hypothetical protein [Deltaproteobacteria bacterium]